MAGILGLIQPSISDAAPKQTMKIEKLDGKTIEATFIELDVANEAAIFFDDEGEALRVPFAKLKGQSIGKISMKLGPVPGWVDAKHRDLLAQIVAAPSFEDEEIALQAIYKAADAAPAIKEKIGLFQLYGISWLLLRAEADLDKAVQGMQAAEKSAAANMEAAREWAARHGINPLTGEDRGRRHIQGEMVKSKAIRAEAMTRLCLAKRDFMIRLASSKAYAVHCELAPSPGLATAAADLRQKVLARSVVAQEIREASDAILAWLVARIVVHNYDADNGAVLERAFAKMILDAAVDKAFGIVLFEYPPEVHQAAKGALIAVTEGKLTRREIVGGAARDALMKFISRNQGLRAPIEIVDRVMPFLDEAVRMGSR